MYMCMPRRWLLQESALSASAGRGLLVWDAAEKEAFRTSAAFGLQAVSELMQSAVHVFLRYQDHACAMSDTRPCLKRMLGLTLYTPWQHLCLCLPPCM